MILIDSNILMYAAGVEHACKASSIKYLEYVAEGSIEAVVDAEVLQEVLHRYRSINRWKTGKQVYDLARQLFPVVIPITSDILDRTRTLLDEYKGLMARDALHAAVVKIHAMEAICSFDRDFDQIKTLKRIEPTIE